MHRYRWPLLGFADMSARHLARLGQVAGKAAAEALLPQPWSTTYSSAAPACCRLISTSTSALQEPAEIEPATPIITTAAPLADEQVRHAANGAWIS